MRPAVLLALVLIGPLALAGCASDSNLSLDHDEERLSAETGTIAVLEEGVYETRAQACSSETEGCATRSVGEVERRFTLEVEGNITGLELSMRWDPVSPAMEELRFGITWGCVEGGGCEGSYWEDGTSPLSMAFEPIDIGDEVQVWAWRSPDVDEGPLRGYASHEQPFTVEGELTVRSS